MTTAVYAGSFDPITFGHLDIIRRAAPLFDKLIVAVGINTGKTPMFLPEERLRMIGESIASELAPSYSTQIDVRLFKGLLVEFCKGYQATVIVRGLRALTDFEYELGIAHANKTQHPDIETLFLPTQPELAFVSSSVARELARHGGKLEQYVPKVVQEALRAKVYETPKKSG